ncbi:unnamed protein product [Effrenium voratum]|nr:unnamed protein product [Effrenium voratum]
MLCHRREVGHFWPRNLANVLWACARLRCGSGGPSSGFLRPAVQQLAAVAPQLTPVELAQASVRRAMWLLLQSHNCRGGSRRTLPTRFGHSQSLTTSHLVGWWKRWPVRLRKALSASNRTNLQ